MVPVKRIQKFKLSSMSDDQVSKQHTAASNESKTETYATKKYYHISPVNTTKVLPVHSNYQKFYF